MFKIKINKKKLLEGEKDLILKNVSLLMCMLSLAEEDNDSFEEISEALKSIGLKVGVEELKRIAKAVTLTPAIFSQLTDGVVKVSSAVYSLLKEKQSGGANEQKPKTDRRAVKVKMQGVVSSSDSGTA